MGLDMYLQASRYVGGYEHSTDDDRATFARILETVAMPQAMVCQRSPSLDVAVSVAYWRKANAVHAWFVRVCGKGVDDCRPCYVEREKLRELRQICAVLLALGADFATEAMRLLPPQEGFFFGSTGVDEGYRQDLADTVRNIDHALTVPEGWELYYRASW